MMMVVVVATTKGMCVSWRACGGNGENDSAYFFFFLVFWFALLLFCDGWIACEGNKKAERCVCKKEEGGKGRRAGKKNRPTKQTNEQPTRQEEGK